MNSQAAIFEKVPVNFVKSVDFPTDGNPTNPTQASPLFATSNPSPPPPLLLRDYSIASRFIFANFAFSKPIWPSVALFF